MKKLLIINILLIIIVIKIPLKVENKETAKEEEPKEEIAEQIKENKPIEKTATDRSKETKREIMTTSAKGIELIKKYEGCKLKAYRLSNEKYYTIGYGHYSSENYAGQQITQEQAEKLLKNDLQRFERYVRNKCKHLNLNQNEFDALVSFTFNCGEKNLDKLIKNRNKQQIINRITNYTNSGSIRNKQGLQKRRNEEKNLFLGGV